MLRRYSHSMWSVLKGVLPSMYLEELSRQLALDYCCSPADVADSKNHFTLYIPQEGRRRFQEQAVCRLKIAVVHGKLLVTGSEEIVAECWERYADVTGEWFFDMKRLRELEELLAPFGLRIAQVHPFYLPEADGVISPVPSSPTLSETRIFDLVRYDQNAILQFHGDSRFDEAFAFNPDAPDVLGIAAVKDGEILGMAGASADSPLFWQIGINVTPHAREMHVGSTLVRLLAQDILAHGAIPYYGTSMSHIASQRVAHRAGFAVAWAELITEEVR